MHEIFRNFTFKAIILLALASSLSGAACGLTNARPGEMAASGDADRAAERNGARDDAPPPDQPKTESKIKAAALAGNYEYNTVKKGEGYANTLTVEDNGAGRLHVSLSGSYIYKANGEETFHEAGGEGDARLTGGTAVADIRDEADKNCRVSITFAANRATVKVPAACSFNVALDGVYKKSASGENPAPEPGETKSPEVAFENLADFIGDEDNRRAGDRFVVRDVPTAKIENVSNAVAATGNPAHKGLFALDFERGADGSGTFLTSKTLVRNLQANGSSGAATLRVTATLVETAGDVEVYRSVYVTKIEGLDKNGEPIWTAVGEQPSKLGFGF